MRVALYTETFLPKIDGICRVACLTLEHFQRRGIEAIIVAPEGGVREYAGAQVIGVPSMPTPFYPELRTSFPYWDTYGRIKAFKPDIVHCFHPVLIGMAGILTARRLHVPSILSFHLDLARIASFYKLGFVREPVDAMTRFVLNRGSYALAPSKLVQSQLHALGVNKIGLWKRGVDAETYNPRFKDAAMREALSDGHPDETILIYVGRLALEKQIEQIRTVLERVPQTRLALVGDGPNRAALERYFEGCPVKFMGYQSGEALSQAYASADIFVFPSAFESFGLVLLEAMASGLPVVSSRVGGAQDIITESVSGYTFDVNDVEALISGVEKIATEAGRLAAMGLAAREHAEKQSWPHMMDELIECYEATIAGQPSPI